jgi:pantothenate kinase type III
MRTCVWFYWWNDNYIGGAISPGLRLRYESLHAFTAKLPLTAEDVTEIIGRSTTGSIHSGDKWTGYRDWWFYWWI